MDTQDSVPIHQAFRYSRDICNVKITAAVEWTFLILPTWLTHLLPKSLFNRGHRFWSLLTLLSHSLLLCHDHRTDLSPEKECSARGAHGSRKTSLLIQTFHSNMVYLASLIIYKKTSSVLMWSVFELQMTYWRCRMETWFVYSVELIHYW